MAGNARVWVLADDRPGNANQALGVAEALGLAFQTLAIRYRALARLPNTLLGGSLLHLDAATRAALRRPDASPAWPEVVIGAGRRVAPVARWLKHRRPDALAVQIMWPGSAAGFDLIAVPAHDDLPDHPNLVRTPGAPHRLTPERLAGAAARLAPSIAHLPRPRIACLVGGTSRHAPFTADDARALGAQAATLAAARGGSLLISTSRRTGEACEDALEAALASGPPSWLYRFSRGGDNPYLGLVGSADALIVTGDSASMCTEACASGQPVMLFQPQAGSGRKLARLHAWLEREGYVVPLGAPWPEHRPPPLFPQRLVAAAIAARLAGRLGSERPMVAEPPPAH